MRGKLHSTFKNSVRDAIRRGAGEHEVQKHKEKLTGVWRQMSKLRRRYEKWCKGGDIEDFTHKQRYEESYKSMVKVLQQNTWIDDRKFLKSCVRAEAEQGNTNQTPHHTLQRRQDRVRHHTSSSTLRSVLGREYRRPALPLPSKPRSSGT